MPCTVLMDLVLTSQSILECNFHTHTDLLGHITMVHNSQATYNVHIGWLTLTAALSGTKGENAAFRLKSLPTHVQKVVRYINISWKNIVEEMLVFFTDDNHCFSL